jgi:hypothetical protein
MDKGALVAEMTTESFKSGIKQLRVADAPAHVNETPFVLLSRQPAEQTGAGEIWVVRGWQAGMRDYFPRVGASLTQVVDLDLEDGFVELLRTSRDRESNTCSESF